jgi:hypothetical protein
MEGEFITVEMLVTNCTRDYEMRCTLIIRAAKRARRSTLAQCIALCDATVDGLQRFGTEFGNEL